MPRGRPRKDTKELLDRAVALAAEGKTELQIAAMLGVNKLTINRWKKSNQEFCNSLKSSKVAPDDNVERSLYERALGYSHPAVKIHVLKDGSVVQVPYIEHYPPDTTACIFWLKNRRPKEWRDRHELDMGDKSSTLIERLTKALERTGEDKAQS